MISANPVDSKVRAPKDIDRNGADADKSILIVNAEQDACQNGLLVER